MKQSPSVEKMPFRPLLCSKHVYFEDAQVKNPEAYVSTLRKINKTPHPGGIASSSFGLLAIASPGRAIPPQMTVSDGVLK